MKKSFAAVLVLSALPLFAGELDTQRYLVATQHPFLSARPAPATQDGNPGHLGQNIRPFMLVNGYAADLTADQVRQLQLDPEVKSVEPVKERHALDVRNLNGQTTPYGISMVQAPATWAAETSNVNLAILDTGIDYGHPDLASVYAGGFNEITKTDDPKDDNGHGTHCAGIAAAANNNIGVVGVAPMTHVWSVKVLNASGSGTSEHIIAGVEWVIAKKASVGGNWVMSLSLGAAAGSDLEQQAFQKAQDAGILTFAASGNESTATLPAAVDFPAAYPSVLAVGAVDSTKTIADFSNQGPELAVVAPGVNVLSTLPRGMGALSYVSAASQTIDAPPVTGSPKGTLTGHFVYCNLGQAPSDFPAAVTGQIALIQRGTITFAQKVKNAQAAGAKAVVIFNKDTSAIAWTLISSDPTQGPIDQAYAWPLTVGISQADGALLRQNPDTTITINFSADDYGVESGTSMATPHAAGVAALVWSVAPSADANAVKQAIFSTAKDLGDSGVDTVYGHGLVDAYDAAKQLAPNAFGSGAMPPQTTPAPGRRFGVRGHH